MMIVATSFGVFAVRKSVNNERMTDVFRGGQRVAVVAADWWNKDAIVNAIESKKDEILAKMNKSSKEKDDIIADLKNRIQILENEQNKVNVNSDNVIEVLECANNVLKTRPDAKMRGFVCSRLSQVINKLNEEMI